MVITRTGSNVERRVTAGNLMLHFFEELRQVTTD